MAYNPNPMAPSSYTDLNGLKRLRYQAAVDPQKGLREAVRQFEAIFVQTVLKESRQAQLADGIFDSDQMQFYQEMSDQQMSVSLAQGGGIGLADLLMRQLGGQLPAGSQESVPQTLPIIASRRPARHSEEATVSVPADKASAASATPSAPSDQKTLIEGFIRRFSPMVQRAADRIGIDPRALLAQAALETGWGRYIPSSESGRNSHNLFGMKASEKWQGETVTVVTNEHYDGRWLQEPAKFRAYENYQDSFDDYASHMLSQNRYASARAAGGSPAKYFNLLQRAGYATDPLYASKVMAVYQRICGAARSLAHDSSGAAATNDKG